MRRYYCPKSIKYSISSPPFLFLFVTMFALSEVDTCITDDTGVAICINHKCMEEVIGQDLSPSFDCKYGIVGTWGRKQQVQAQMNSYVRTLHYITIRTRDITLACLCKSTKVTYNIIFLKKK